jgi:hypothetical protein
LRIRQQTGGHPAPRTLRDRTRLNEGNPHVFITRIRPILFFSTGEASGGGTEGPAPETAPETAADTPAPGTGITTEQPQIPEGYVPEDRYKEAQAWGTRSSQKVSALLERVAVLDAWNSGDPAKQQWAAEQLGIQLQEDDEQLDETGTPGEEHAKLDPSILQRMEAFEAFMQQQAQQEQQQQQASEQAAQYQAFRKDVDPRIQKMGVPDGLVEMVAEAALNRDPLHTPHGQQPDLDGAWGAVKEFLSLGASVPDIRDTVISEYRKTKQAPKVASGGAGTQVPSLDTNSGRVAHMMDRLAQQQD